MNSLLEDFEKLNTSEALVPFFDAIKKNNFAKIKELIKDEVLYTEVIHHPILKQVIFSPDNKNLIELFLFNAIKTTNLAKIQELNIEELMRNKAFYDIVLSLPVLKQIILSTDNPAFIEWFLFIIREQAEIHSESSNSQEDLGKLAVQTFLHNDFELRLGILEKCNALIMAAYCNRPRILWYLLSICPYFNLDINYQTPVTQMTALMLCYVSAGHASNLEYFFACFPNLNLQDREGETALMFAIRLLSVIKSAKGRSKPRDIDECKAVILSMFKNLLEYGPDLDIQNNEGKTALHIAVELNYNEFISPLINAKANLNIQDNQGKTALHIAVELNYKEFISPLINAKADLNIQDNQGNTPLLLAARLSNAYIRNILIYSNARIDLLNLKKENILIWAIKNKELYTVMELLSLCKHTNMNHPIFYAKNFLIELIKCPPLEMMKLMKEWIRLLIYLSDVNHIEVQKLAQKTLTNLAKNNPSNIHTIKLIGEAYLSNIRTRQTSRSKNSFFCNRESDRSPENPIFDGGSFFESTLNKILHPATKPKSNIELLKQDDKENNQNTKRENEFSPISFKR